MWRLLPLGIAADRLIPELCGQVALGGGRDITSATSWSTSAVWPGWLLLQQLRRDPVPDRVAPSLVFPRWCRARRCDPPSAAQQEDRSGRQARSSVTVSPSGWSRMLRMLSAKRPIRMMPLK